MWNKYCISVYNQENNDWMKIEAYLQLAHHYGCKEVFTSAHLPEEETNNQLQFIQKLSHLVHENHMELTVDFGGESLHYLLNHNHQFKDMIIDYVRMDYGYEAAMMEELATKLNITGFIWNASTMNRINLDSFLLIYDKHPEYRIRACHNFYPRKETGLDRDFVLSQNKIFHVHGIPVTTCIPNPLNTRAPLHESLPTIEAHRIMSFEEAVLDCVEEGIADDILIGDLWLNENQLSFLWNLLNNRKLEVKVYLLPHLSEKERKIILGMKHHIRYDSNHTILRSQSSREMAEYAVEIEPHCTKERVRGSITIDNKNYGRYSGELQIVLSNLEADCRVNVCGMIHEKELLKFNHYRDGFIYELKEAKNE